MSRGRHRKKAGAVKHDRWDGYESSLDSTITDAMLLDWLESEVLGDLIRHRHGEQQRQFDNGVMSAMVRATPGVVEAWYGPVERSPLVKFENGHIASWTELSDGFHIFLGLVGEIARRAFVLNEADGMSAAELIEGVVLIDEIDLHLHPRWQRVVLDGLRKAFPKLQFVVSTHSPQVLSSAENRQVRRFVNSKLDDNVQHVAGRDSNAILREFMHTDDRDEEGVQALRKLYDAIDDGKREIAEQLYQKLFDRWGDLDPELIRVRGIMELE